MAQAKRLSVKLADEPRIELVETAEAHGRTLATELFAEFDHPRFANSAMDGWAVRSGGSDERYAVVGESRAGRPHPDPLMPGQAVKISTGAELPIGADAVVPLEHGVDTCGVLRPRQVVIPGEHIRAAGRHRSEGAPLVTAGQELTAGHLAAVAAFGTPRVPVTSRPRVALIAGGDELLAPGDALVAGSIYDSNTPLLTALMRSAGAEVRPLRYAADDLDAVRNLLAASAEDSDVIVTVGGISVGDHDHVAGAIAELGGEFLLVGTAARPGRRLVIAQVPVGSRRVTVFCVPGNPISSWVCFQLYVRRHLAAMLGRPQPQSFEAELIGSLPRPAHGSRIMLGGVRTLVGARSFRPCPCESDDIFSIAEAEALTIIGSGVGNVRGGSFIDCERVDV